MKISVLMGTRLRPVGLIAVIQALSSLSSKNHEISYIVRYDNDDWEAPSAIAMLDREGHSIIRAIAPRPMTIGHMYNQGLEFAPEFDALCIMSDDVFPCSPNWDEGVRIMIQDRGFLAFAWNDHGYPGIVTHPVMSKAWLDAAGKVMPDWFPFWFSDTWMSQVYEMATGEPMTIATDMVLASTPGKTNNMREFQFWLDFWLLTRKVRVSEAEVIRQKLGLPEVNAAPILEKFERFDKLWNVDAIVSAHGDDSPPGERYFAAKARAEGWISANA